jgi:hypothetical protein
LADQLIKTQCNFARPYITNIKLLKMSSFNHISDARARGVHATSIVAHSVDTIVHSKVGGLNIPVKSDAVHHRSAMTTVYNSTTPSSGLLGSSSSVDFRLQSGEPLRSLTFKVDLLCDAAFSGTALPLTNDRVFSAIDCIEILPMDTSLDLYKIESDHIRLALSKLESSQYLAVQGGMVGTSGYSAAALTLDAGESGSIYIPVMETIFTDHEIAMSALSSPCIIRIKFRSSTLDTSFDIDISKVSLLCDQWRYDQSIRARNLAKFSQGSLDFRFALPKSQSRAMTITPNQNTVIQLQSVHGMIQSMHIVLKMAGGVYPIESVDIQDSGGTSLFGQALSYQYLQCVNRAREHRRVRTISETMDESELYFEVPIGEMTASSESLGQVPGYIVMNGTHQLVLVYKSANSTPVAAEVTVLYKQVATARIDRGVVSLTRA